MSIRLLKTIFPVLLCACIGSPIPADGRSEPDSAALQSAAQVSADGTRAVLILLHESKNGTACPDKIEKPSQECENPQVGEAKALAKRLRDLGAERLEYFSLVNMMRADIPENVLDTVRSEPAVAAVFPVALASPQPPVNAPAAAARASENQIDLFGHGGTLSMPDAVSPGLFTNPFGPATGNVSSPSNYSSRIGSAPPQAQCPFSLGGQMPGQQFPVQSFQSLSGLPGGMPQNGLPPFVGGGLPGSFGSIGVGGRGMVGILENAGLNFGMSLLSSRGGMAGMLGGLAGNIAYALMASRSASCKVTVSPEAVSFPTSGGKGSLRVHASQGCAWQASRDGDWIQITDGAQGVGPGVVAYKVDAASPEQLARSGSITIGGEQGLIQITGKRKLAITESGDR